MAKNLSTILVTPVTTEKAYGLSAKNVYVFNVPLAANKNEITDAIKDQYGVDVKAIKTLVQSGKAVRFSRGKNRYPGTTTRSDSKKAYVTLAEGSSLAIFEQPEEPTPTKTKEEKK
ncbi:MAG: 50S ribosomal protein L23 [Candidatus Microsaccharimonas sp.]